MSSLPALGDALSVEHGGVDLDITGHAGGVSGRSDSGRETRVAVVEVLRRGAGRGIKWG